MIEWGKTGYLKEEEGWNINHSEYYSDLIFFGKCPEKHALSQFELSELCLALCNAMYCSTPGFPCPSPTLRAPQTHVHQVSDSTQPSQPLSSPSPPAFNLSQHQGLFQGVSSSHQVAKVLEFQLQHQSFQWIFRTDFLQNGLVGSHCSPRYSQVFSDTTGQKHQFLGPQLSL